ncbi:hypothetical protein WMR60_004160 [Providencia rettgeri]
MKKNKIFNLKILFWVLFFPFIGSLLSVCGVFIGYIVAYFKIGVFPIDTALPKILGAFKVGGILGLLLGISLWIWGIVIPELMGKSKQKK